MCDSQFTVPAYGQSISTEYPSPVSSDSLGSPTGIRSEQGELLAGMDEDIIEDEKSTEGNNGKPGQGAKRVRKNSKRGSSWRQSNRTRRLVANARERSRIHIMSEAFEGLRRAVPCYSHDQKLSKLAILRIATSYISALAYLTDSDTSDKSLQHFADSVDQCTKALQSEGRSRRKDGRKLPKTT